MFYMQGISGQQEHLSQDTVPVGLGIIGIYMGVAVRGKRKPVVNAQCQCMFTGIQHVGYLKTLWRLEKAGIPGFPSVNP